MNRHLHPSGLKLLSAALITAGLSGCNGGGGGGGDTPPPIPSVGSVAIIHAADPVWADEAAAKMADDPDIGSVVAISASSSTPSLAELQAYDAIIIMPDGSFADSVTLGDNVADYADSCGGVVQGMFSYNTALGGRFATDNYFVIPAGTSNITGQQTLGTVNYAEHPTMAGVTSFDGGTSSYRPNTLTLVPGGTMIATWSDGMPLVATRNLANGARRVDLGFYLPSADSRDDFWDPATDGVALMTNAVEWVNDQTCSTVVHKGDNTWSQDIVNKIAGTGMVDMVTFIDGDVTVASADDLMRFDSVLVSTDGGIPNSDVWGDNLADAVDGGTGVVLNTFSMVEQLGGRFLTDDYYAIHATSSTTGAATLGTVDDPAHALMEAVQSFNGGTSSYRNTGPLHAEATQIAAWSDGTPLVVTRTIGGALRADVNFYPVSEDMRADFWVTSTDGDVMMANALAYTGRFQNLRRYASADPALPVPIADFTTSTSTVDVSGATTSISELKVHMDITHTWDSDLDIRLIAPDGVTAVWLTTDNGESVANFTGTTFADDAGTAVVNGSAPYTGQLIPEEALAAFNGMDANGTWTLEVYDDAGGDTGSLNKWAISVR